MALSIKSEEADRLARELARITGQTMTEAITQAMRERLERLQQEQAASGDYIAKMQQFVAERASRYNRHPVTDLEWDEATDDNLHLLGKAR